MHRRVFLIFLSFIFIILFMNFWWIMSDKGEMHRAESFKFFVMHSYYSPNQNAVDLDYYPPGYFIIPIVFCKLLNLDFRYKTCLLPNGIYFILTLIGLFLMVNSILKKASLALISCLILTSFPLFLYCTKKLFMEIAIVPWVIFAVYLILINKNWQSYSKAMFFGVISGIGLLFKWTFLLYIAGPFIMSILHAFRNNIFSDRKRTLLAFLLSGFSAFIICGWWYVLRFSFARWLFHLDDVWATATNIDRSYWNFLQHNIFISMHFLTRGVSYSFLGILLLCLIWHWKKIKSDLTVQIIIWFIFSFVILCTLVGDSQPRYLLPILPALAILIVILINGFPKKFHGLLSFILVLLCAWNIFYETFIYHSARTVRQKPLDPVIEKLHLSTPGKRPLYIGFNGLYDSVTCNEVFDIFVMLWVYMVDDNLPFDMRYFKKQEELKDIRHYDYIISQQTENNKQLHGEFIKKGYDKILQFRHHYFENSDPLCDWESDPDYIIFRRVRNEEDEPLKKGI